MTFHRQAAFHQAFTPLCYNNVMSKRLFKVGNSYAILIEKPIRELLGITKNTEIVITTDGERLFLTPIKPKKKKK